MNRIQYRNVANSSKSFATKYFPRGFSSSDLKVERKTYFLGTIEVKAC